MKKILLSVFATLLISAVLNAQQRVMPGGMNYLFGMKPNNILYHDTLYRGSREFAPLLQRSMDPEILRHYHKHQANKIAGNLLGFAGTVATIIGLGNISGDNKGNAWLVTGGGFAAMLTGGYLIFRGQQHLQSAVDIFNLRYNHASLSLGVGDKQAGLVLKF
jgi:hypothetical protein